MYIYIYIVCVCLCVCVCVCVCIMCVCVCIHMCTQTQVPRPTSPYMTLTTRFINYSVNRMAGSAIKKGSLRLILPNGTEVTYGDSKQGPAPGSIAGVRGAKSAPCHSRVKVYDCNMLLRLAKVCLMCV